jgi:hypothetical protein
MKITVRKRTDDYIAFLNDNKKWWDCGKTPQSAIGNLILTHKNKMNMGLDLKDEYET